MKKSTVSSLLFMRTFIFANIREFDLSQIQHFRKIFEGSAVAQW